MALLSDGGTARVSYGTRLPDGSTTWFEYKNYGSTWEPGKAPIVHPAASVRPARNGLCPCGSGRKFKRCCLSARRK